jgi:hypothetical protein
MKSLERRKLPRFHISPCQFHCQLEQELEKKAQSSKNFSVQDLSLGGLSIHLIDRSDLVHFQVGAQLSGVLKVEGKKLDSTFVVRYFRGLTIGAEWVNPSNELMEHLRSILSPMKMGQSLKSFEVPELAVDGAVLTENPKNLQMKWYHAPVGVDLLLYTQTDTQKNSHLERWILFFHQSFLQWEKNGQVRSGQSLAEDDQSAVHGVVRLETRLLDFDESPDRRLLETARDFIKNVEAVAEPFKKLMTHHIEGQIL